MAEKKNQPSKEEIALRKRIGNNITAIFEKRAILKTHIPKDIVTYDSVARWSRGETSPSIGNLAKLSSFLKVDAYRFFAPDGKWAEAEEEGMSVDFLKGIIDDYRNQVKDLRERNAELKAMLNPTELDAENL